MVSDQSPTVTLVDQIAQPRWATKRSRRGVYVLAAAIICCSLLLLYRSELPKSISTFSGSAANLHTRSNWFNDEGWFNFDSQGGLASRWTTLLTGENVYQCDEVRTLDNGDRLCVSDMTMSRSLMSNAAAQALVRTKKEVEGQAGALGATASNLAGLRSKRILVLGDSIDRNFVTDLADFTSPASYLTTFELGETTTNTGKRGYMHAGAAALTIPIAAEAAKARISQDVQPDFKLEHSGPVSEDEFRLDFVFLSGSLGDKGDPSVAFGPVEAETRIRQATRRLGTTDDNAMGVKGAYDAIYLNLGFWDLAAVQRHNLNVYREDNDSGFSDFDISRYTDRLEEITRLLQTTFPGTPVILRLLHDVRCGTMATPARADDMTGIPNTPTFRLLRVSQMRNAQIAVAKRNSALVHPFALRMAGQDEYTIDTLHPNPKADLVYIEMVLRHLADSL